MDFLQNKNREYERKLREANYQLDSALTDRQRVAKKLQVDKEIVVQAADREMNEAKVIQAGLLLKLVWIYLCCVAWGLAL